jgi:mannose-6-phosphate isomerase-like protein (cupin superfamily)
MNISRFSREQASPAHAGTILAAPVVPPGVKAPFGHAWGHLDAGQEMEGHTHPTEEIYFVHAGEGVVVVGQEEAPVRAGDVVSIPADSYHTMKNPSDGELLWFALWWPPLA